MADRDLPGRVVRRTVRDVHELGDGLGTVEFVSTVDTYDPWGDLAWLLDLRGRIDYYSGPDYVSLRRVVDGHVARVLAGHEACGCDCGATPTRRQETPGAPCGGGGPADHPSS